MNSRTRTVRVLSRAVLGAAAVLAVAGCSVASGATAGNAALGPVRTGAAAQDFAPFPVPPVWYGLQSQRYAQVVKSTSGTAPRNFTITANAEMVFWLNCIGGGTVSVSSPVAGLNWSVPCGDGADPRGLNVAPPRAAVGHEIKALVTATAGSRWEVRIDRAAPPRVPRKAG